MYSGGGGDGGSGCGCGCHGGGDDDQWHYSQDGRKPSLIWFHSLS